MTLAPIHGLHHFAYRCRDAEETRHFYEDILGLPLAHVIKADRVPSTGEECPYVHVFFQMRDGSFIAFFDLGDNVAPAPSPNTPAWVNHLALRMNSVDEVLGGQETSGRGRHSHRRHDRPWIRPVDLFLRPQRDQAGTDNRDHVGGGSDIFSRRGALGIGDME